LTASRHTRTGRAALTRGSSRHDADHARLRQPVACDDCRLDHGFVNRQFGRRLAKKDIKSVLEAIFGWMATPQGWASLLTLAVLEIVLGIDNVIFISIAAQALPKERQQTARRLFLALFLRIALLSTLVFLAQLSKPLFSVAGLDFSWRDIILISGGLYLLYKATIEIDDMVRAKTLADHAGPKRKHSAFFAVVAQIAVVDLVFALDSIITAVGMTNELPIMITAVVLAVLVMMLASDVVSHFIEENPTTKMLALTFLVMVGMALIADGFGFHVERAFLYFAIGFSVATEALNILAKRARDKAQQGVGGEGI
jgi:predicted tellurium resistance membrane protein TerC